jgi:hypothetical protein
MAGADLRSDRGRERSIYSFINFNTTGFAAELSFRKYIPAGKKLTSILFEMDVLLKT